MLKFSTGVTLVSDNGSWSIRVKTPKGPMSLTEALSTFKCGGNTSGTKLAEIVNQTLSLVLSKGRQASLQPRAGRVLPLIMLKDFLTKIAGPCPSCRGRGCKACNQMGV